MIGIENCMNLECDKAIKKQSLFCNLKNDIINWDIVYQLINVACYSHCKL